MITRMSDEVALEPGRTISAPWPVIARVVAIGAAFDIAVFDQAHGLALAIFVACLAVFVRSLIERSVLRDVLLLASVGFGSMNALRAGAPLAVVDTLAACALIVLAAIPSSGATLVSFFRRVATVTRAALEAPAIIVRPVVAAASHVRERRWTRAVRAAAVATPLVALFALLLASADRVFARAITPRFGWWKPSTFFAHAALVVIGTLFATTLWRSTARTDDRSEGSGWSGVARERVPFTDWALVLGAVDVLFAGFVAVQFAVLFGGRDRVTVGGGLTYAEYARSGFFQLIVVAALTTLVILAVWDFGRSGVREQRSFRILVTIMTAMTGVILASALKRLALYEGTFGFTLARFLGYVAILTIGVFLAGLLVLVWTDRRRAVLALAIGCITIALIAVNVIGPDRFVAQRNLARFEATGKLDVSYLTYGLGPDAVPVLVDAVPSLTRTDARALREALCATAADLASTPSGWRSANAGRAAARAALADLRC
jgi:hypothetical protein